MKEKILETKVYEAEDDTQFDSEEKCLEYEKKLKDISYFRSNVSPDLTETGLPQETILFAVHSKYLEKEMCIQWLIKNRKNIIEYVQGSVYGICPNWTIPIPITKEDWNKDKKSEKIFIYSCDKIEIEGYPEPVCITDLNIKK
jgi:hypothetical protein